jgi:hypothetical protein
MLKNQFESAINENGVDNFIESFLKKCRKDMVGEISRNFNEERDRIGETAATTNLINRMSDLKNMKAKRVDVINFTEIDMEKFIAEEIDAPKRLIKSQFNLIKELSDNGAYEKGWLVQVVAPTSSGKTLWLLNEAIHFADSGLKVFWLALGDMLKRDLLERTLCITTQTDRTEVRPRFKELWKDPYVQKVLANIDFVVERSKRLTASDISNITLSHEVGRDPYDVVIVDYDDNMKREQGENGQGGGSMYEDGGNAYAELVNLAQGGEETSDPTYRLVFVAAQAKPGSWNKEELPLDSVACSSQKAMKANLTISLNRNAVARNVGTMSIVKHRHGKEGSTKYVREEYGVFRGIDKREYENLVNRSVYDSNMASATESPIVMPVMSAIGED